MRFNLLARRLEYLFIRCYLLLSSQHGGAIHSLYETLKEKITSEHEPDSTTYSPNPDYLESPLMSVPTPAAL